MVSNIIYIGSYRERTHPSFHIIPIVISLVGVTLIHGTGAKLVSRFHGS